MVKSREMDMTKGPILKKLIICAVPLILTNLMQLLFNATDIAVVGMFVGDSAVAAVGSNVPLINLIIGLFVGLSSGANVVLAKSKGANDLEQARRVVGTSVFVSIVTGSFLIVVGVLGGRTFLTWMSCPPEVIDMAVKYLTIYFIGMPIIMLYNFLASILRAVGDNFRPMLYLFIGGVVNVGLNIFFVTACGMDADGVAIATVVSQAVSATLCLIAVIKSKGYSKFSFKYFRIYKREFIEILKIGLPSGVQGCFFSLSNVILQSTVNKLGELTVAANSASGQFDGAVYLVGYSVALACMSFVSQNFGAGDMKRVKKVIGITILVVFVADIIVGSIVALFSEALVGIMTKSPEVIKIAQVRFPPPTFCAIVISYAVLWKLYPFLCVRLESQRLL